LLRTDFAVCAPTSATSSLPVRYVACRFGHKPSPYLTKMSAVASLSLTEYGANEIAIFGCAFWKAGSRGEPLGCESRHSGDFDGRFR
jgi:hypothetical protein